MFYILVCSVKAAAAMKGMYFDPHPTFKCSTSWQASLLEIRQTYGQPLQPQAQADCYHLSPELPSLTLKISLWVLEQQSWVPSQAGYAFGVFAKD